MKELKIKNLTTLILLTLVLASTSYGADFFSQGNLSATTRALNLSERIRLRCGAREPQVPVRNTEPIIRRGTSSIAVINSLDIRQRLSMPPASLDSFRSELEKPASTSSEPVIRRGQSEIALPEPVIRRGQSEIALPEPVIRRGQSEIALPEPVIRRGQSQIAVPDRLGSRIRPSMPLVSLESYRSELESRKEENKVPVPNSFNSLICPPMR